MQLLLCCATAATSPTRTARIAELLTLPIDWSYLYQLAWRHKLLPLVALHLRDQEERVPAEVRDRLRVFIFDNARRVLQVTGELIEILGHLDREGITALPYKGPALSVQLYGNVALRHAGDLDLLVRRRDVGQARTVLKERGYQPRPVLDHDGEAFMLRSRYSQMLYGDSEHPVELHWAFTNGDIALPLELDSLLPNVYTVSLGRNTLPVFGLEDLLLVLCVHGSKHRWDRLEWICGVAEAVRQSAGIDWEGLIARAAQLGVRRMVLLGLLLAHDLLEAPVPAAMCRQARNDPPLPRLAAQVPELLADTTSDENAGSLPIDVFRYRLRERRRDRLRFLWYRFTTPSRPESWMSTSLAGVVLPLHAFRRPFQVWRKLLPALREYIRSSTHQRS